MPGDGLVVTARAALRDGRGSGAELADECRHAIEIRPLVGAVRIEP
jgi:hypothetical protein